MCALEVEKLGEGHGDNSEGRRRHRRTLTRMDPFDDAQQPRCPECGTVMRDVPGGWKCGGCGHADYPAIDGRQQPTFDGPSINGG